MQWGQSQEKHVLPNAAQVIGIGTGRIRRAHVFVFRAALVKEPQAAHAHEQFVVALAFDQVGNVELERQVSAEMLACFSPVDQYLRLTADRFEVQPDPAVAPGFRNAERAAQPTHLNAIPTWRVTRVIDRTRPIGMHRAFADVATGAPGVHIPGRRNLNGCGFPLIGSRQPQFRSDTDTPFPVLRQRYRLKLPTAIQTEVFSVRLLRRFNPTFFGRKIASEFHASER